MNHMPVFPMYFIADVSTNMSTENTNSEIPICKKFVRRYFMSKGGSKTYPALSNFRRTMQVLYLLPSNISLIGRQVVNRLY